ncbi:MAG TPA: hypothetical protein VFH43_13430 [Candidatus Kapabacteria bacterium]|jgi:quinol monooxygenase YgiN|nr:hypothetical protein [Candidatus Kapabacteria bacterium]
MASTTLVTVSYTVRPEKLDQFDALIPGIAQTINSQQAGVRMSVYRDEDEATSILEVYECDAVDSYDNLEDALDEQTRESINRIAAEFATARQSVTTLNRVV